MAAFPVILIPALTGLNSETNPNETIRVTAAEASWLGLQDIFQCGINETTSHNYGFQAVFR